MIGNCQASAIAQAMRLLLPEAGIRFRSVYRIRREFPQMSDLVEAFRDHDAVFALPFPTADLYPGGLDELGAGVRLVRIPAIVFSAFHPDLVYVTDGSDRAGHRHVHSPIGAYNSALALYGYLADLTVEETLRLYRDEVFRALTYLDLWEGATAVLLRLGADAGYDLADSLMRWTRRGTFMHSINHPKMFVACDLARGLLGKAGIAFDDFDLEAYAFDELMREGTYPVYPEIGEQYGVKGGYAFVARAKRSAAILRNLGLRDFVAGSFAGYARRRRQDLVCPRVDAWLIDSDRRLAFRDWAGQA